MKLLRKILDVVITILSYIIFGIVIAVQGLIFYLCARGQDEERRKP